jgi:hypothetical protein
VKQDPLALAFFGGALALLAALLLYVGFFKKPEPAAPAGTLESLRKRAESAVDKLRDKPAPQPAPAANAPAPAAKSAPAPVSKPAPAPVSKPAPAPATKAVSAWPQAGGVPVPRLQPGRSWRYAVVVDPQVWSDITLTYRTQQESGGLGVLTDFAHAGGKSNFHLGIFAAGHPSHANTRFPGFFMYAAYLKEPLRVGDPVVFSWHWQGRSTGSVKRFEGQAKDWKAVKVPAGTFEAVMIEGTLSYLEDGQFRERTHLVFWYAPSVSQVIKIHRFGMTSDERSRQIDAELVEYR